MKMYIWRSRLSHLSKRKSKKHLKTVSKILLLIVLCHCIAAIEEKSPELKKCELIKEDYIRKFTALRYHNKCEPATPCPTVAPLSCPEPESRASETETQCESCPTNLLYACIGVAFIIGGLVGYCMKSRNRSSAGHTQGNNVEL